MRWCATTPGASNVSHPASATTSCWSPLTETAGTVVMWERLDRVLGYHNPDGSHAMRSLDVAAERIREHLEMVFHRFLSGDLRQRRRRVRITLDGERLTAWDPFARSEPRTERLRRQSIRLEHGGRTHTVSVLPYVLPAQIQFTSPAAHARAAGPARWNRQQGFYIYRADRLIQSGGWNRLRTTDEHSKLARIALDIPTAADPAFGVNVSKMRISLPPDIRAELAAIASGVVAQAQEAYRQRVRLVAPGDPQDPDGNAGSVADADERSNSMSAQWPRIARVLHEVLGSHPDLLRRTLVALANLDERGDASLPDAEPAARLVT